MAVHEAQRGAAGGVARPRHLRVQVRKRLRQLAREVDAAFCGRAVVVVEDRDTALRECGDVVQAIAEGTLRPQDLVPMRDVALGARRPREGEPVLFKGSGMSWQDLVVARAVLDALEAKQGEAGRG